MLIEDATPLRLRDLAEDPRSVGFPPNHPPMRSFLGAPVSARGQVFGNLYLTEKQDAEAFTGQDERALVMLAGQAGVAIENARLYQDARDPDLQRRLGGAVEELDRVIGDLRNYIFGLRPGILADRQLDQALRRLAEELEHKAGVVTVVEVDPEATAALTGVAAEVVQLAREALSNVSRHAQATTCRVSRYRDGATVVPEVDDDGRGFDPARVRPEGQGLGNLRARAQALGGRVELDSQLGEGTRVRVQLTRPSLPA